MSKKHVAKKHIFIADVAAQTGTVSQPTKPLSQQELEKWWPFHRLNPKLMPQPEYEDAPF
jgi:hypothetical protein